MPRARKYPEELIERGVRLALESGRPVAAVARDLGVGHEVLRKRVRQAEADGGLRPDLPTTEEREEIKKLRKENSDLDWWIAATGPCSEIQVTALTESRR